ncbi:hypothetical protein BU23DRAFT_563330 [Bimuria novae-zelandiae CBS 107.79]|uniref:Uncharacterized protein n=1 Tax=Bimuria novae-zelandiae CBS 107.79 TaxID=1447943 RepID=A0A6A5VRL2_9PLEO|nr:hypothetical protein BU23DRAFT_563330 [Bimuria novae-zelandiae CBS 107.79]
MAGLSTTLAAKPAAPAPIARIQDRDPMEVVAEQAAQISQLQEIINEMGKKMSRDTPLTTPTRKGEAPLIIAYYNWLKELVKDKLVHQAKADNLDELINNAITVNNRLFERKLEKQHGSRISSKRDSGNRPVARDQDGDVIITNKARWHKKQANKGKRP